MKQAESQRGGAMGTAGRVRKDAAGGGWGGLRAGQEERGKDGK